MANLSYTAAQIDALLAKADTSVQPATTGDLDNLATSTKTNLVAAINETFTNVSNGKTLIAAAITDKGVATAATDSFSTMAQNIEDISSGGNIETSRAYTVSSSGNQTISPDTGYDAMEEVALTVPAGSATPASSISATGASVSAGTNALTFSKSVSNTPQVSAGYIAAGTAGTSNVSLTANVTTKAADTIHPSTSDQSIASGTYLTGAQTVKAVTLSNLSAENIKKDVVVKIGDSTDDDCVASVTGTYEGGGGGDIWSWLGRNPFKLQEWTEHKKFSETDFATWTFTTTQTTIASSASYSPTITANCAAYDYVQVVRMSCHYDYGDWTPSSAILDYSFTGTVMTFGWRSTVSAIQTGVPSASTAAGVLEYYAIYAQSNGVLAVGSPTGGLYATSTTDPTISSSTLTPILTFKSPTIYARGYSSSYFTANAFSHLDMEASYYDLVSEIWRVDAGTSFRSALRTNITNDLSS